MEKMYMVPFNNDSTPDNSLCTDGLNFSINEPFLLIANKPIPKHGKVYMEICVSKYSQISLKRNIPIYVGIHKEPAFGILNSDFCIGSVFYTAGKDFDIMSKYNANAIDDHWVPDKIYSRIPGATDIIGIGVDYDNNLISIYNNGKLFYTITPKLFNMKDETNFYFCMWGNIPCAMKGYANFGKAGTDYLPKGYNTIYGQYYRSTEATNDIACDITVDTDYSKSGKDVAGFVTVNNDIMGDGSLFLESNKAVLSNGNMSYKITHQDSSNYLMDGANVFCNLPIPDDCKVYAEFEIKDGSLIDNIIGIPASIGISNAKSTILSRSLRMPLYHKTWHKYTYTEVKDLAPTVYQITDVDTSVPPEEGKIVGVAMDLANNSVSIYVNKVLLYTFKARLNDFANRKAFYYLFLHDEGAFKNYISGTFNAGKTLFAGSIPEGYISLYDYYNRFYKIKAYKDINCEIHVLPYYTEKDVYIHCDITVVPADTAESLRFDYPGLNKLMNTYNTIEDDETHTSVDKDINYLNTSIAVNNNGYCPEDKF